MYEFRSTNSWKSSMGSVGQKERPLLSRLYSVEFRIWEERVNISMVESCFGRDVF